jgi:vacuolar protein sorting-associated protein 13A/C
MIKQQLAKVLEQSVGKYVEGLNSDALNLSIWSGKIELTNLSLKPEALDELHLPVVVERGSVGRIKVSVPWKSLWSQPVEIEISDIELVARKRDGWDWSRYVAEAEKSAEEAKQAALDLLELGRVQAAEFSGSSDEEGEGYGAKMVTMILENLVIRISNIHFRFVEDGVMVAGLRLNAVNLETTDAAWQEFNEKGERFFKKKSGGIAFKSIDLDQLSIYCDNPDAKNPDAYLSLSGSEHNHILKPTTGRLLMKKTPKKMLEGGAPVQASLQVDEIAISLSASQFNGLIQEAELFGTLLMEEARFKSNAHRPAQQISAVLGADKSARSTVCRAWWRFAGKAVIDQLKELYFTRTGYGERYTWKTFMKTVLDRREYINLWKRTQEGVTWLPKLTKPESERLTTLDKKLLNQSIIMYRTWGTNELAAEKKKAGAAKAKAGWFGWGGDSEDGSATTLTQQEMDELHKAIDDTEVVELNDDENPNADPNALVMAVDAHLPKCTLTLEGAASEQLVTLTLGGEYSYTQFNNRSKMTAEVDDFAVDDACTPGTKFPSLVKYNKDKAVPADAAPKSLTGLNIRHNVKKMLTGGGAAGSGEQVHPPLLSMEFTAYEKSAKSDTDFELSLHMEPLDFVFLPDLVARLTNEFEMPQEGGAVATSLMDDIVAYAGEATIDQMEMLNDAFETRSFWKVLLDVKAPRISLVENILVADSPQLLLDLGRLIVKSERPPKDSPYDQWVVNLSDVQAVCLHPPVSSREAHLGFTHPDNLNLLDKFSIEAKVRTCILPLSAPDTRLIVESRLPLLSFQVGSERLKVLARLQAALVPPADPEAEAAAAAAAAAAASSTAPEFACITQSVSTQQKALPPDAPPAMVAAAVAVDAAVEISLRASAAAAEAAMAVAKAADQASFEFELDEFRVIFTESEHGVVTPLTCLSMSSFRAEITQQGVKPDPRGGANFAGGGRAKLAPRKTSDGDGAMVVNMTMGKLQMQDQLVGGHLISCVDSEELVSIACNLSDSEMVVDLKMCHVHFEFQPRTIRRVRQLLELLAPDLPTPAAIGNGKDSPSTALAVTNGGAIATSTASQADVQLQESTPMRIKALIAALSITFNNEDPADGKVVEVEMQTALVDLTSNDKGEMDLHFEISDLSMAHLANSYGEIVYPKFFDVRKGENLVDIKYKTTLLEESASSPAGTPVFLSDIDITLGTATFVCVPRLVLDLVEYLNTGVMGAVMDMDAPIDTTATNAPPVEPAADPMKVKLNWTKAEIRVPRNADSTTGLSLDIEHLALDYEASPVAPQMKVALTALKGTSVSFFGEHVEGDITRSNELIKKINWKLAFESSQDLAAKTEVTDIKLGVSKLELNLQDGDLQHLQAIGDAFGAAPAEDENTAATAAATAAVVPLMSTTKVGVICPEIYIRYDVMSVAAKAARADDMNTKSSSPSSSSRLKRSESRPGYQSSSLWLEIQDPKVDLTMVAKSKQDLGLLAASSEEKGTMPEDEVDTAYTLSAGMGFAVRLQDMAGKFDVLLMERKEKKGREKKGKAGGITVEIETGALVPEGSANYPAQLTRAYLKGNNEIEVNLTSVSFDCLNRVVAALTDELALAAAATEEAAAAEAAATAVTAARATSTVAVVGPISTKAKAEAELAEQKMVSLIASEYITDICIVPERNGPRGPPKGYEVVPHNLNWGITNSLSHSYVCFKRGGGSMYALDIVSAWYGNPAAYGTGVPGGVDVTKKVKAIVAKGSRQIYVSNELPTLGDPAEGVRKSLFVTYRKLSDDGEMMEEKESRQWESEWLTFAMDPAEMGDPEKWRRPIADVIVTRHNPAEVVEGGLCLRNAATGKYLVCEADGRLRCDRDHPGVWEHFYVDMNDDQSITIKGCHGKYVSGSQHGQASCDKQKAREWESFFVETNDDCTISLRSKQFNCYLGIGGEVVTGDRAQAICKKNESERGLDERWWPNPLYRAAPTDEPLAPAGWEMVERHGEGQNLFAGRYDNELGLPTPQLYMCVRRVGEKWVEKLRKQCRKEAEAVEADAEEAANAAEGPGSPIGQHLHVHEEELAALARSQDELYYHFGDCDDVAVGMPGVHMTIVKATYGSKALGVGASMETIKANNADYTERVQKLVKDGMLDLKGGIHQYIGDPEPGVPKRFRIWCIYGVVSAEQVEEAAELFLKETGVTDRLTAAWYIQRVMEQGRLPNDAIREYKVAGCAMGPELTALIDMDIATHSSTEHVWEQRDAAHGFITCDLNMNLGKENFMLLRRKHAPMKLPNAEQKKIKAAAHASRQKLQAARRASLVRSPSDPTTEAEMKKQRGLVRSETMAEVEEKEQLTLTKSKQTRLSCEVILPGLVIFAQKSTVRIENLCMNAVELNLPQDNNADDTIVMLRELFEDASLVIHLSLSASYKVQGGSDVSFLPQVTLKLAAKNAQPAVSILEDEEPQRKTSLARSSSNLQSSAMQVPFKVLRAAYGNSQGSKDVTGILNRLALRGGDRTLEVTGGHAVLRVPGGKGAYKKHFGEPATGGKELHMQYELGSSNGGKPHCAQVRYTEDSPIIICTGTTNIVESTGLAIMLEVLPMSPLELRLDSSMLMALTELGDDLTDPSAEDAEFEEMPSFYNDMSEALWSVGQSVGMRVYVPQLLVTLSPPDTEPNGRPSYPQGNLLKLEVNHIQLAVQHHGSETAFVEDAGAMGQEIVLALGSVELSDLLPGLTAPLIFGTPRASSGVTPWIHILNWPMEIGISDDKAPIGLLPDLKLFLKRAPDHSIQQHFSNVAIRLNYPVQLHAGIEFVSRLLHWQSELTLRLDTQTTELESRTAGRLAAINKWREKHPEYVVKKSEEVERAEAARKAKNAAAAAAGALISIDQLDIEPIELRLWWAAANGDDFKIQKDGKIHHKDIKDPDTMVLAADLSIALTSIPFDRYRTATCYFISPFHALNFLFFVLSHLSLYGPARCS